MVRFITVFYLYAQTQKLAENLLHWTKEGGFVFFRESCFSPSGEYLKNLIVASLRVGHLLVIHDMSFDVGNKLLSFNPTEYRSPQYYNALFSSVRVPSLTGGTYRCVCVRAYVRACVHVCVWCTHCHKCRLCVSALLSHSCVRFQMERCKNVDTYVMMKGNKGQLCWLWKKVS